LRIPWEEKGCVKDLNWELGGQMRMTLGRQSPLYRAIYCQRTSTERSNGQSKAAGLERPKVRNLNTLTYLVINARADASGTQAQCLLVHHDARQGGLASKKPPKRASR